MSKKRFNVVYGEKYGDPNDPKTAWKRCGTLFLDETDGKMSVKIDTMPVSKHFDGWFQVFEQTDDENGGTVRPQRKAADSTIEDVGDDPINLDDIPF